MTRTQIQLPDELYKRAKRIVAEQNISLAEMMRRGLEMFLDRYSAAAPTETEWKLPTVDGGGLKVPLASLRDFSYEDEMGRLIERILPAVDQER